MQAAPRAEPGKTLTGVILGSAAADGPIETPFTSRARAKRYRCASTALAAKGLIIRLPAFLGYLALPARLSGLLFVAAMTLGFTLAVRAGFLGIPLGVILVSWLFKYGFVLLEHVAHGVREPPVLTLEMVNPASDQRPLVQLAIAAPVYVALRLLGRHVGTGPLLVLEALALAALPASIAVLGIGNGLWQALHPRALWHVVRALGPRYAAIIAVGSVYAYGVTLLRPILPGPLLTAAALFGWLSWSALIGGCLYEERALLGYVPSHTPERAADRRRREVELERSRFIDTVYGQARGGNLSGAWRTIEQELSARNHDFETYDWLLGRVDRFPDGRLAHRLAQEYLSRALGRDNGRVVRLVRGRLEADAGFRPRSATETLRVAELARLAGERSLAQRLVADFKRHFPDAHADQEAAAASLAGANN
jgi:hypothetical protein